MVVKRVNIFIWCVLALGWIYDFLFWEKVTGISIPIFLALLLAAGFFLSRQQGLSPSKNSLWLLIPISFFGLMSFYRLEPMTSFLNIAAALGLMAIFAHSFLGGKWWQYTFKDYFKGILSIGGDSLFRQIAVLSKQPDAENSENEEKPKKMRTPLAVLRGLLLAIPVVLIFAGMLAEADPIFEQGMDKFIEYLKIENLGEFIGRVILSSIVAYLLLGVYIHSMYKNHDEKLANEENRIIPRFLGFTESAIVLGSVNLLFLTFVFIQFQYFFGGKANINLEGFTYAEYARRGFGELVAVAVFSLLLFMGLSFITKKTRQSAFSGLGILLVSLVTVILVSSFQRLLLYEEVYGFTRLRTYTHVFIIWLGVLLLAVILLEVLKRQRQFALAVILTSMGFIATLDVINVDGLIVRQNLNRARRGEQLDISHLAFLSEDILPMLADQLAQAEGDKELTEEINGVIACHSALNDQYSYESHSYRKYSWQSFHLSRYSAQKTWQALLDSAEAEDFDTYKDSSGDYSYQRYVIINGEKVSCHSRYTWD